MKLLAKIGILGLVAGATAQALSAEPAGGWLSPNGQSAGAAQGAPAVPQVVLSQVEIQARVSVLHEQIRADARHVQYLQQIARKAKDVIKLNCVNDKLVQIKPQMNLADAGELELASATDDTRMASFEAFTAAVEGVRRLREEADQCIGETIATEADSSNSFTGPDAPDDPTKPFPGGDGIGIEAPGYASPFN